MKYPFTKVEAAGNDFIIIEAKDLPPDSDWSRLAITLCKREKSRGADGMLLLEESKLAHVRMRVFNPDGTEVEMCGNGARCVALYKARDFSCPEAFSEAKVSSEAKASQDRSQDRSPGRKKSEITIETKAGILRAEVDSAKKVKLKVSTPKDIKLDFDLEVKGSNYKVNYINTGVPHVVLFVDDLEAIDVLELGSNIRYHRQFQPKGANVDFVKEIDNQKIEIRTYERGVEGETLACGTGALAAAIITAYRLNLTASNQKIDVLTRSREHLQTYFNQENGTVTDAWLEGSAEILYKGRVDYV